MRVPDEIRRCTVFVGFSTADGETRLAGTAFFVAEIENGKVTSRWVVTARHVLELSRPFTDEPDQILLRVNQADSAHWMRLPANRWIAHPDASKDVAVFEVTEELDDSDALFFPLSHIVNEQSVERWNVGVGDEVLIAGLFQSHSNTSRNIPIVRIGFIAAMPEEPVATKFGQALAYLIEARSIGGLSGSPAFLSYGPIRTHPETGRFRQLSRPEFALLGLVHGHFSVGDHDGVSDATQDGLTRDETNSGIAIVTPVDAMLEAIKHAKEDVQAEGETQGS